MVSKSSWRFYVLISFMGLLLSFSFSVIQAAEAVPTISNISVSDLSSGWLAGATKAITFNYSGFSTSVNTVKLEICHPTNNSCQSWNASAPIENISLTGSGTQTITKATGARLYERLSQNDPALTPYFNNFQTRLNICPSSQEGIVPSGANCAFGPIFSVVSSTAPAPSSPSSRLTNLVVGNGSETEWAQNTSKKITWQTSGSIPYVDIFVCRSDGSTCGSVHKSLANINEATVTVGRAPGEIIKIVIRKPNDLSSNLSSSNFLVVSNAPPATSIGTLSGVTYDPWAAGATKRIVFTYQNFSQTAKASTVSVKICHPSEVPETCKPGGLGLLAEDLNLQGSGSYTIQKTVPSDWYERLSQDDLSILRYANVYRGEYKFKLKICPSDSVGNVPTSATCGGYIIFRVVGPTAEPPTEEEPPVISNPSVSAVTISDVGTGWPAGVTKLIKFDFLNFSSSVGKIKVYLCHPTNTPCQSWNISTPIEAISLVGSGTKTITKTTGTRLYERLQQNDPALTPYFSNYLGNYLTKLKICPVNSSGVTPAGAICGYSNAIRITAPPDASSGQGCFDGECVCVDGIVKRCGSPMRAGTGCSLTCGPISLSDKLLASLSFISDGVFIKLDKIFGK